jgi:hypothetical protein
MNQYKRNALIGCVTKKWIMVLQTVSAFVTNWLQLKELYMHTECGCILSCLHYRPDNGGNIYFDVSTLLQDYTASPQSRRQQSPKKLCVRTKPFKARTWCNKDMNSVTCYLLSYFDLFLPTHCRCRGLLLHLITLNNMHTLGRTPLYQGLAWHRPLTDSTQNS